jgi:CARDB/PKD domain
MGSRFIFTLLVFALFVFAFVACEQSSDDSPTGPDNEAPNLVITVNPTTVNTWEIIQFDVIASSDDHDGLGDIHYRWDYTGDGIWDDDWSLGLGIINFTPVEAGTFSVIVEGRDTGNMVGQATATYTAIGDQPPAASLVVTPEQGTTETVFTFDASGSTDDRNQLSELTFWIDFDGDGNWDDGTTTVNTFTHTYAQSGTYTARIQVADQSVQFGYDTATVVVENIDPPDLTVFDVSSSDYELELGEDFTLSCTLQNVGNGPSEITQVEAYWSHDDVLDMNSDYYLGVIQLPALQSNQQTGLTFNTSNPTGDDPEYDTEWLFIIADPDENLVESDEGNNVVSTQVQCIPTLGGTEIISYDDGPQTYTSFVEGVEVAVVFDSPYSHYKIVALEIWVEDNPGYVDVNWYHVLAQTPTTVAATASDRYLYGGWNTIGLDWEVDGQWQFALGFLVLESGVPSFAQNNNNVQERSNFKGPGSIWRLESANYVIRAWIRPYLEGGWPGEIMEVGPVRAK